MRFTNASLLTIAVLLVTHANSVSATPLTGNTGPGGFVTNDAGSNFRLWLKADALTGSLADGAAVTSWTDSSAFGYNATGANAPIFDTGTAGVLNGKATVNFNHVPPSTSLTYLENSTVLSAGAGHFASQNATLFTVYRNPTFPSNNHLGIDTTGSGGGAVDLYQSVSSYNNDFRSVRIEGAVAGVPSTGAHIKSVVSSSASGGSWQLFSDGAQRISTGQSWGLATTYSIGRNATHASSSFTGQVGETVIFNVALNSAERTIVDNYLSAKFDVPLNTGGGALDRYNGDNTGLDFDDDVFGVGRIDAANQSVNAGAAGFGIEVVGGGAASNLNDGEFIMAGHKTTTNSIVAIEGLGDMSSGDRWARYWHVDTTGSADATLGFNFADAGLGAFFDSGDTWHLLYTSDPNAASWEVTNLAPTLGPGNTILFNITADQLIDGYYTLALNVIVLPEPSSLIILAGFVGGIVSLGRRRRANRN